MMMTYSWYDSIIRKIVIIGDRLTEYAAYDEADQFLSEKLLRRNRKGAGIRPAVRFTLSISFNPDRNRNDSAIS